MLICGKGGRSRKVIAMLIQSSEGTRNAAGASTDWIGRSGVSSGTM